jgi:hypothetical protein
MKAAAIVASFIDSLKSRLLPAICRYQTGERDFAMALDTDVVAGATPTAPVVADRATRSLHLDPPQKRTCETEAIRADVLGHVVAKTEPAALPNLWRFLAKSPSVRRLGGDRRDFAASLQQHFSDEDLVASRILVRSRDSELQLSPVFGDASSKFLLIYDGNNKPIDAISVRGRLSSCDPPFLRYALARQSKDSSGRPTLMILASTDDDLHVLHQLRLNCTSAAGLERLSGKHARQLFGPSFLDDCHRKYFFTLTGWQIADVVNEPSQLMQQVFSHLCQMEQVFDFDPSRLIDVWSPNADQFGVLQSALAFDDARVVQEILFNSLNSPRSTPTESWYKILDAADTDLTSARAELKRAIGRSRDIPRVSEVRVAVERLRRSFEQSVIDKFNTQADATSDPQEKMRLLMRSELAQHWFDNQELLATAQLVVAGECPRYAGVIHDDNLDERLRIGEALLKQLRPG